jgi:DNA-binding cell septation regulator SpoVG
MQVTEVKLIKSQQPGIVKAFGKATLEKELVVDVLVMDKDDGKGPWASFPNGKTGKDGKYYHPIFFKTKENDTNFKKKVIESYLGMGGGNAPQRAAEQPAANLTANDLPF